MKKFLYILMLGCLTQSCTAQSKARLIDAEQETVTKENFSYYLYYPEDYDDENDVHGIDDEAEGDENQKDKKFPLLLFLHGGGGIGQQFGNCKAQWSSEIDCPWKEIPLLDTGAPKSP